MNAKYFIAFNCCLSLTFLYRVDRKSSHETVAIELMFDTLKLDVRMERIGNVETLCASAKNISDIINNKFLSFRICLVAARGRRQRRLFNNLSTKWMRAKNDHRVPQKIGKDRYCTIGGANFRKNLFISKVAKQIRLSVG